MKELSDEAVSAVSGGARRLVIVRVNTPYGSVEIYTYEDDFFSEP